MFEKVESVQWPTITPIKNEAEAVHCFKLANTQLQRALKVFVIDGYVTEYVKINQSISKLYKQLTLVD